MDNKLFHSNNRQLFADDLSSLSNLDLLLDGREDTVVNVVILMDWHVMYRDDDWRLSDRLEKVIDLPRAKWLYTDVVE